MKLKLKWKGCLLTFGLTILIGGLCIWVLFDRALDGLFDDLTEIPVDTSKTYFHKSSAGIEFIEEGSGVQLPERHTIHYIIESENLLPPYTIESHVTIEVGAVKAFLENHNFKIYQYDDDPLGFLRLFDELPAELRPKYQEGELYTYQGGNDHDAEVEVWCYFLLNSQTGDLWIQYNTE